MPDRWRRWRRYRRILAAKVAARYAAGWDVKPGRMARYRTEARREAGYDD